MKAITTRYIGPSNTKGARIVARGGDGKRMMFSYPYELSGEACHAEAAIAYARKMGWTGTLIGGATADGYVFVFAPEDGSASYAIEPRS